MKTSTRQWPGSISKGEAMALPSSGAIRPSQGRMPIRASSGIPAAMTSQRRSAGRGRASQIVPSQGT